MSTFLQVEMNVRIVWWRKPLSNLTASELPTPGPLAFVVLGGGFVSGFPRQSFTIATPPVDTKAPPEVIPVKLDRAG